MEEDAQEMVVAFEEESCVDEKVELVILETTIEDDDCIMKAEFGWHPGHQFSVRAGRKVAEIIREVPIIRQ